VSGFGATEWFNNKPFHPFVGLRARGGTTHSPQKCRSCRHNKYPFHPSAGLLRYIDHRVCIEYLHVLVVHFNHVARLW
jgi:hypothetical protein